jgi:dolichol-phosphate mannosyltransferase
MAETHLATEAELAQTPAPVYSVSVVVPVYNEVDNLRPLHQALTDALHGTDYELVYVDDGSRDGSIATLTELAAEDPTHARVI